MGQRERAEEGSGDGGGRQDEALSIGDVRDVNSIDL